MEKLIRVRRKKKPIISIVIPTFNEEKYLEETLLSLKWQNFSIPYEIIVSDSNSKDRTIEIAKKYVDKIVITDRKGIAVGRNLGAKYAEGEYILFLDADTMLLPNALKEIYKEIKKRGVSLVSLPVLPSVFDITLIFYYLVYDLFSKNSIKIKKPQVAGMLMCCKKKDFERIGGFNEEMKIVEDYDFSIRIGKIGKVKILNSSLAITSPRRLVKWGKLKGATKYLLLYLGYLLGVKKISKEIGEVVYKPVR